MTAARDRRPPAQWPNVDLGAEGARSPGDAESLADIVDDWTNSLKKGDFNKADIIS